MNNTRVLACQIDEKLQKEMKEYVIKEEMTVKSYVTGLIREDLEKHKTKENLKQESKEQEIKVIKQENPKVNTKTKKEIIQNVKDTKIDSKKQILDEKVKTDIDKKITKKKEKEEEEEFE